MTTLARIDRFRQMLAAEHLDGAVVRHPANVHYLTGYPAVPGRPSFVVVGGTHTVLVAPGAAEAAQALVRPDIAVHGYAVPGATIDRVADVGRLSADALHMAVEQAGLAGQRIGIEEMHISAFHAAVVARHGPTVAVDGTVESLRRIKDDEELAAIRAAVGFNDLGFAAARQAIAPGVTELAVQDAVVGALEEATGMSIDVLDDTNCFISGPRTRVGVGATTSRRLQRGDLMIIDLNPFIHGYKGDTTRTFSVGPASPERQRIHDTLVRALEAAEQVARPGVRACDVYAALAHTIIDAGYGGGLSGHGGHAIGLEHLERPYIIPGDELPLEERMVLTLEPGIYLPEIGGLRIEDNYLVTAGGLDVLSHLPRELVQCG